MAQRRSRRIVRSSANLCASVWTSTARTTAAPTLERLSWWLAFSAVSRPISSNGTPCWLSASVMPSL